MGFLSYPEDFTEEYSSPGSQAMDEPGRMGQGSLDDMPPENEESVEGLGMIFFQ